MRLSQPLTLTLGGRRAALTAASVLNSAHRYWNGSDWGGSGAWVDRVAGASTTSIAGTTVSGGVLTIAASVGANITLDSGALPTFTATTGQATVALVFEATSYVSQARFISKESASNDGFYSAWNTSSATWRGGFIGQDSNALTTPSAPSAGMSLLVNTMNAGTMTTYLNGATPLTAVYSGVGTINFGAAPMRLGMASYANLGVVTATAMKVKAVIIDDRAWTAGEVALLRPHFGTI